ncbi:hypothetical protein NIES2119_30460 [[Phormidium ambiguum] IAM M-71]|uniref:Uncharacterized protein n=1 Tax=[Phormidium ambiguum] IAM M-71 TaxID=454136 RepID=A0A1U7I3P9_9CYAN|nr:hypothetical protein [Phormidium ambiguum]OKH30726.1 hypothetical protein NIES2119_30460 [Phormidium ambiguum IAM M-71]
MDDLNAERIESLKAGICGALSLSLAFSVMTLLHLFLAQQFPAVAIWQTPTLINLLFSGGVAFLSGFLFGITYRYIIRQDENSHLQEGAVLSFGLVRGLAQVDIGLKWENTFWSLGFLCIESLLLFAFARFALDLAIYRQWVKSAR